MSGDRQPRPQDRVRYTVEGIVVDLDDHECVAMVKADGEQRAHYVPRGADVEVLEPADDPSKDPDGTTRRFPNDRMVFVTREGADTRYRWVSLTQGQGTRSDAEMVGSEVIGAVPGTAAAEQHMHNAGYCGACNMVHDRREYVPPVEPEEIDASTLFPPPVGTAPRVFKSDGPEPPEDVTILEKVDYPENRGFPFTKRGAYGWTNCETPDADTSNVHGFKWPPGYDMTFREVTA